MPNKSDTTDAAIARVAARQHGVVTAKQLAAVGLGRAAISERTKSGRLHRLHRGVYAVGHRAPSHHARWMAAVLACGEGAVLSHGSAAALWQLLKPLDRPIHVSVPTTSGPPPPPGPPSAPSPSIVVRRSESRRPRPPLIGEEEGEDGGSPPTATPSRSP